MSEKRDSAKRTPATAKKKKAGAGLLDAGFRNKKGLSLVELVTALAVFSLAVVFGMQLFFAGAKAAGNGSKLDAVTEQIAHYYETGDRTALAAVEGVQEPVQESATVTATFGSVPVQGSGTLRTETVTQDGKLKTSLSVFKGSIPGAE